MRVELNYSEKTNDFLKWFTEEKPLTLWNFVKKYYKPFDELFDTSKEILENLSKVIEDNFYNGQKACLSYYFYNACRMGSSTLRNILVCYYIYIYLSLDHTYFCQKNTAYINLLCFDNEKANKLFCHSLYDTLLSFDYFKNIKLEDSTVDNEVYLQISNSYNFHIRTRPNANIIQNAANTIGLVFVDNFLKDEKLTISNIKAFKDFYKKSSLPVFSVLSTNPTNIFTSSVDQFIDQCMNNPSNVEDIVINSKPYWYTKKCKTDKYFLFDINELSIVDTENEFTIKVPDDTLFEGGISYRKLALKDPQIFLNHYVGQPVRNIKPFIKDFLKSLENCENILKYKLPKTESLENQFNELKKSANELLLD